MLQEWFQTVANEYGKRFTRYNSGTKHVNKTKVYEDQLDKANVKKLVNLARELDPKLDFKKKDVKAAIENVFDANRNKWA